MSHSLSLKSFACWVVLGAVWSWSPGEAAEPRIYIMTDLEGASGVYKFAQTREPDPQLGERAKEYLMEDIRYVVRGCVPAVRRISWSSTATDHRPSCRI